MKQKLLTLFAALLCSMTMFADGIKIGKLYYNLDDETMTASVTASPDKYSGEVTIPASVEYNSATYDVTSIGDQAFLNCTNLTTVTIKNGVKTIGAGAFTDCTSLSTVNLPNSVTSFEISAFVGCVGLKSLTLPNALESIEAFSFERTGLQTITIPNSVTYIGAGVFQSSSLQSITLGSGITELPPFLFSGCYHLSSFTIPKNVTKIGHSGWYYVPGWGGTYTNTNDVFGYCEALTAIDVAADNPNYCSVDGVVYSKDMTEIVAFPCGKTHYTIPDNFEIIQRFAFSGWTGLESITIPSSVYRFGYDAFRDCTNLKEVHVVDIKDWIGIYFEDGYQLGSGVPGLLWYQYDPTSNPLYYGAHLYVNGTEIKDELVIPEGVERISAYNFFNYTSLTSVTFPKSLKRVYSRAFDGCTNLKKVNVNDLADWCDIDFRQGTIVTYVNEDYSPLYEPDRTSNPLVVGANLYVNGTEIRDELVVPDGVTKIGENSFYGYSALESVTLPDGVTSIGNYAFAYCSSLTSINIPNGVTSIGDYAFAYCTNLTTINIPNSVTSIAGTTFKGCTSLPVIDNIRYMDQFLIGAVDRSLSSYTIREGTKWIGPEAFDGCANMTSITIPNSIVSIGRSAFGDCKSLPLVTIPDNVTSIGEFAFGGCSALNSVTLPE
jgi:hypothetical protein